jgi:hypothetical protein
MAESPVLVPLTAAQLDAWGEQALNTLSCPVNKADVLLQHQFESKL